MKSPAALSSLLLLPLIPLLSPCLAKDTGTFAVLRFNGASPLTQGSVDPIVSPGVPSKHAHVIQGASNFGLDVDVALLAESKCSTAKVGGDLSVYWSPKLYFHDPKTAKFESVPYYYMNVYYFFEATDDEIVPFPKGLQILAGDNSLLRPANNGTVNLDPTKGEITAARWTCPRTTNQPPTWPVGSDGSFAGMAWTDYEGFGFPVVNCDGLYSPLRADIHFPSCYDPSRALTDYKHNMAYPTAVGGGKTNCPKGWLHVPHLFYEIYWNTQAFADRWTPDGENQPFVLSNGDVTGYSLHADFIAGWDEDTLKTIIDTCNVGSIGMQDCPQLPMGLNTDNECTIPNPVKGEVTDGVLDALPGDNPLKGFKYGGGNKSEESKTVVGTTAESKTEESATAVPPGTTAEVEYSTAVVENGYVPTPTLAPISAQTTLAIPTSIPASVSTPTTDYDPRVTGGADSDGHNSPYTTTHVVTEVETIWEYVTVTVEPSSLAIHQMKARDRAHPNRRHHHHHHHHLRGGADM